MDEKVETGQWIIAELMGRKVVAGYGSQSVRFGVPLLRIDVPDTSAFPAFTVEYGGPAIYGVTYVSEEVARMTAEHAKINPVSVYVPDLAAAQKAMLENEKLRRAYDEMRDRLLKVKGLPEPGPGDPDTDPTRLIGEDDELFDADEDEF